MERSKYSRPNINEVEKWMLTAQSIGISEYTECWTNFSNDYEIIPEIQEAIICVIEDWANSLNKINFMALINDIEKTNHSAYIQIISILPDKFKRLFRTKKVFPGGQLPIELCCPIPFFPYERKLGERVYLKQPIVRNYGEIKIEIHNILCKPDDLKCYVALNQILKDNPEDLYIYDDHIFFRTTYTDIAKELGYNNPWDSSLHEQIRRKLERLCDMRIRLKTKKMNKYSSLLLDTCELEEDSSFTIKIAMSKMFLDLMQLQFIGFDEKELYQLTGKLVNLYIYLNRDKNFNKNGFFNSKAYKQHYWDIYENASLRSPFSKPITRHKIYLELSKLLDELENKKIIDSHKFHESYLRIGRTISVRDIPKE